MAALFSAINTPFVNAVTLKRIMATRGKDNIFQGIVTRPEEACTEKYSTDTDAAEIQIIRLKPNAGQARDIGADKNGGYFNSDDAYTSSTEAYGIKILSTIDYNIDIPTNMQDMINVDAAEGELRNLTGKVAQNVNAVTIAAQLAKWLTCQAAGTSTVGDAATGHKVVVDANPGDNAYLGYLLDANGFLDDGNAAQGIDTYPRDNRCFLLRSKLNTSLKKQGVIIGGSNYGQIMVRTGALDEKTTLESVIGYVGDVDNTPCYVVSDPVWKLAEKYLGLQAGALDKILGLAVCSIGTGRALAFNESVKTIPSPNGQGIRIQPKYRFGAECWDEYSVVPIVANGYTTIGTKGQQFTVVAPGSRA